MFYPHSVLSTFSPIYISILSFSILVFSFHILSCPLSSSILMFCSHPIHLIFYPNVLSTSYPSHFYPNILSTSYPSTLVLYPNVLSTSRPPTLIPIPTPQTTIPRLSTSILYPNSLPTSHASTHIPYLSHTDIRPCLTL